MPRGHDQAGNLWEYDSLDASGNPVNPRRVQPNSFPGSIPGVMGVVPPNPAMVAKEQRDQARQDAADRRAQNADARAAQANAREQAKFQSEDTANNTPGDATKTGEDYLATLPGGAHGGMANRLRAMSEGRLAYPTSSAGARSPIVNQMMNALAVYDPSVDFSDPQSRVKTRISFTSGDAMKQIRSLNMALGHLGSWYQNAAALHNRGLPAWNAVANTVLSAAGKPLTQGIDADQQALSDELPKVFSGTAGALADRNYWMHQLSSSKSPEQFRSKAEELVKLMTSRIETLQQSYQVGMGRSRDAMDFLNPHAASVFQALGPGGDGNVPDLPKNFGGLPPVLGGSPNGPLPPPPAPPSVGQGGGSPKLPGGVPRADYSSMVGGPTQSLAVTDPNSKLGAFKQTYRNEFDPVAADTMRAFIRKGTPYETASAYATSHGFNPPDPEQYAAALAFQHGHPGATPNVEANRSVPTTLGERLASSPLSAALAGGVAGGTAGISDTIGRTLAGPGWDANRQALAALNPGSDIAGNLAGGIGGAIAAPELLAKYAPGALGVGAKIGGALNKMVPGLGRITGDAAYGATYGANENPNDPVMGGLMGALAGAGGGIVGRKAAGGLANIIAPPEGTFGPTYAQGVFPTPGQRFGGSGLAGRMVNGVEQAMQSVPVLGAAPAAARQATRDAFQVGAFNNSLKELQPFVALGHDVPAALPGKVGPGTEAHSVTKGAFDKAYDVARSGMQFVPDDKYVLDTTGFAKTVNNGVLSPDQTQQVSDVIKNAVTGRLRTTGGVLDGSAYKAASSDLSAAIDAWGRDPAKADMASALSDYQTIFDNAARRNSDPQAVNLLDAADKGYAQFVRIQKASQMGGAAKDAGTFTPVNYAGAVKQMGGGVRSNAYSQGTALGQDYAQAGLNLKDTLADSGTPTRLAVLGGLQGAEGAGLAATHSLGLLVNPKMIGAFAPYLPGVREVTNRLIAPRQYTLPPALADPLNLAGSKINQIAPFVGKAAVPGSLAYLGYAQ